VCKFVFEKVCEIAADWLLAGWLAGCWLDQTYNLTNLQYLQN
jgi:hypothetical protein